MVGLFPFPLIQTLRQAIEDPLYAYVLINHLPEMDGYWVQTTTECDNP